MHVDNRPADTFSPSDAEKGISRSRERGTVVERLGDGFFREFPSVPGVYSMCGATVGLPFWMPYWIDRMALDANLPCESALRCFAADLCLRETG